MTNETLLAALLGAITWNLLTWRIGLPSSSTHALIGGLVGAALVQSGTSGVEWSGVWQKVILPGITSPVIGFIGAFALVVLIYRLLHRVTPGVTYRGFRYGQLASGTWLAFTHGANDAQKTMGVIALALVQPRRVAGGLHIPTWVKIAAGLTIAAGTYVGGWRIIRTLGPAHLRDATRARLRLAARRGLDPLDRHEIRLPDLDHPRRLRLRDGRRLDPAALGGEMGSGGEHRLRVDPHAPGRRARRSAAMYYPVTWIFWLIS